MADAPRERVELLTGWSRTAPTAASVVDVTDEAAIDGWLARAGRRGLIARGLGRSYGDAAQNAGGTVLDATTLAGFHDIDLERGVIRVDAGVSLEAIMRTMVPLGWFVHVTPGTRLVTVGGAIAADVHGKSHHVDGSFANHVESFTLHTPKGTVTVSPESDAELFWGTAGALGLTGVIAEATIRLLPIETSMIRAENLRCPDLDSVMSLMIEGDAEHRFSAAWIDCLATGASLGRSVLSRGDHARVVDLLAPRQAQIRLLGGSNAQRDMFFQMLIDSAMKAERRDVVSAMIAHETATRAVPPAQRAGYAAAARWLHS